MFKKLINIITLIVIIFFSAGCLSDNIPQSDSEKNRIFSYFLVDANKSIEADNYVHVEKISKEESHKVEVDPIIVKPIKNVVVDPSNNAPIAYKKSLRVNQNGFVSFDLSAKDADGDSLIYISMDEPLHGHLFKWGNLSSSYMYIPEHGYYGEDSFSFVANDGISDSNEAVVSIKVQKVARSTRSRTNFNHAPIAMSQYIELESNSNKTVILSGFDEDGDVLTYKVIKAPLHGVFDGVTYTPNLNYHGIDSFTFKANDGMKDSVSTTIYIDIIGGR